MSILKDYVGLHVQFLVPIDRMEAYYLKGIIKYDGNYGDYYLVLDKKHHAAHDCDGLTENEYGWWIGHFSLTPNDILILDGKSLPNIEEKISKKIQYLNKRFKEHQRVKGKPCHIF